MQLQEPITVKLQRMYPGTAGSLQEIGDSIEGFTWGQGRRPKGVRGSGLAKRDC